MVSPKRMLFTVTSALPGGAYRERQGMMVRMSRTRILLLRILVANYVVILALLVVGSISFICGVKIVTFPTEFRQVIGAMGTLAAFSVLPLFAYCVYHWGMRSTEGFNRAAWLAVLLLTNLIGIVIYYLVVIEGEYRARAAGASASG